MTTATEPTTRHLIVYQEPGRFCGWPANHGIWHWGDEILVGFERALFEPKKTQHSIRRDRPSEMRFARSLDGGESWRLDGDARWTLEHPSLITSAREAILPLTETIDFSHPDFVMKSLGAMFVISYDRGKQWQGPYALPDFGKELTARTDYIVDGAGGCLLFLSAKEQAVQANLKDRAFCAYSADGGKSYELRGDIAGEPYNVRAVMPSTVRGSEGQLISALRRRLDTQDGNGPQSACWIDLHESRDEGYTWQFLSKAADTGDHNGNPPSLIRLHDGRLCVAYGYRAAPFGIRARLSTDEGRSWGKEILLRTDGRTWDLGYPRMMQRRDGKIVTIYYYTTTENPEQHIAASIWDPTQIG